jgi:hypothetical protein
MLLILIILSNDPGFIQIKSRSNHFKSLQITSNHVESSSNRELCSIQFKSCSIQFKSCSCRIITFDSIQFVFDSIQIMFMSNHHVRFVFRCRINSIHAVHVHVESIQFMSNQFNSIHAVHVRPCRFMSNQFNSCPCRFMLIHVESC